MTMKELEKDFFEFLEKDNGFCVLFFLSFFKLNKNAGIVTKTPSTNEIKIV